MSHNTNTAEKLFDEARAETFANQLMEIVNHGTVSLMVSVGHRTGLFDVMRDLPPSTSSEIAKAANLNERYVREWLGAMATGGIVEIDPDGPRYRLPAEHAAWLTRAAAPNNFAVMAQFVGQLGAVEDQIVDCFYKGGGVPYEQFTRFHEIMAEDSGQTVLPALIDSILPLAPGLTDALDRGIEVADIGCGRGLALMLLAENYPHSSFVGYDFSQEAIDWAKQEAAQRGLTNISFEIADAATWTEPSRFDLICAFDAIHDQAHPAKMLANVHNNLKPGGTFLAQDIAGSSHVHNNLDHPIGPTLYTVSCMHCMTVSLAYGGDGLGTMWGEEKAREMLSDAGFKRLSVTRLPHDVQNTYYVAYKE